MTAPGKRAGRPIRDFILALLSFTFLLGLVAVVIAILSLPTLTLMGAIALWVMWVAGVGA